MSCEEGRMTQQHVSSIYCDIVNYDQWNDGVLSLKYVLYRGSYMSAHVL